MIAPTPSAGPKVAVEVHHAVPRCLLTLRDQADSCADPLSAEGLASWMDYECEALLFGVDPDTPRDELAAMIEGSASEIPREEHRELHAGDFARCFLEAISLRMLMLDFLLRAHIVHRTKRPVSPRLTFGQLIGKAKGQGFRQSVAAELESYNARRNDGIHSYLLGRGSYQDLGDAYRDADGLFEHIIEVIDLPPFVAE